MLVIMFDFVHANFEIILAVLTLLVVLFLGLLLVKANQEAENFRLLWREKYESNIGLFETTRRLRNSFESVMTKILEQADEYKDPVAQHECSEILYSLLYETAPRQQLTRLPVRTKYFKGIMSDGNPV
jgi:hypothetical protein